MLTIETKCCVISMLNLTKQKNRKQCCQIQMIIRILFFGTFFAEIRIFCFDTYVLLFLSLDYCWFEIIICIRSFDISFSEIRIFVSENADVDCRCFLIRKIFNLLSRTVFENFASLNFDKIKVFFREIAVDTLNDSSYRKISFSKCWLSKRMSCKKIKFSFLIFVARIRCLSL